MEFRESEKTKKSLSDVGDQTVVRDNTIKLSGTRARRQMSTWAPLSEWRKLHGIQKNEKTKKTNVCRGEKSGKRNL